MLGLPTSSILREEDLLKTSGVISFFSNNHVWGPPSGYSERGCIPSSRICGSGVLSVDEDSETHQLPSFGALLYPAGERLLHSRSPPVSPFGEGPAQGCCLEWGRWKATVSPGERGVHCLFIYMKINAFSQTTGWHAPSGGYGLNPQLCTAASAVH